MTLIVILTAIAMLADLVARLLHLSGAKQDALQGTGLSNESQSLLGLAAYVVKGRAT